MKIKFVLGYEFSAIGPYDFEVVSSWDEIQASDEVGFSLNQYHYYQLLSLNDVFWNEIIESRKKLGLKPEGWSWELMKAWVTHDHEVIPKTVGDIPEFFSKLRKEESRIRGLFKINTIAESQVRRLILGNFVFAAPEESMSISFDPVEPPDIEYYLENDVDPEQTDSVSVYIFEQVSKNHLIRYIENNWDKLERLIQTLPQYGSFILSERDRNIVRLRDEKSMTYKKIADWIEQNMDISNHDGSINQDSIKTAYHRAKEKIQLTARKR